MMHYTIIKYLRPGYYARYWPLCILLAALVACTSVSDNLETVEPEAAPTDTAVPNPSDTAVPTPTDTAVPPPTAAAATANLNEPFALAAGEETAVGTEGLTLHFESVLEDSRCPTQVDCVWSGQARILIVAAQPGQEPVALEFNTNPAPDQTVDELTAYGYTVQLIQLDPYPQTTDPIPFADYRAQLVVTRP